MTIELLPCPFCGGTDVKVRTHSFAPMSWVSCLGCGLEAPTETGVTDEAAVAYWNRRATPPQEHMTGFFGDLLQALSRLAGNRHTDGVSSLVSREDRETIINGCHDLMIAVRQAPAPDHHVRGDDANSEEAIQARLRMQYRLGYNTALEEAAKIADEEAAMWGHTDGSSARVVAKRIRGLASEGQANG